MTISNADKDYLNLARKILENGEDSADRTGTGTRFLFGEQLRFNLKEGLPILTTKKIFTKGVIYELLWFLKGGTNIKFLVDNNINFWNDNAYSYYKKICSKYHRIPDEFSEFISKVKQSTESDVLFNLDYTSYTYGDLGQTYGASWVNYNGKVNQIKRAVELIKNKPNSRQNCISAWNPLEVNNVALPWCHPFFQFRVTSKGLSTHFTQRSADYFLGAPFNILSYAILTHCVASVCDLEVNELIVSYGDVHIYNDHKEQIEKQIQIGLGDVHYPLPKIEINKKIRNIFEFSYEDIKIIDYKSHPVIKAKMSV